MTEGRLTYVLEDGRRAIDCPLCRQAAGVERHGNRVAVRCWGGCPAEEVERAVEPLRERVVAELDGSSEGRRVTRTSLASVHARPVRWLWRTYVPLGKVTVLAGAPGLGKSMLTARLAAMVSTGSAPGDLEGERHHVLLASAEDDPEDTIKPRAIAAGADLHRVELLDLREQDAEGQPVASLVQLPRDAPEIDAAVRDTAAKLVILDPVVAFLDENHSAYREQEVRAALAPLKRLAEDTGCAVVVVMHLNKADGADPLRRIANSGAFTALARSVLLLGPDPEDEDGAGRILAPVKGNLRAATAGGLALRIEPERVHDLDGPMISSASMRIMGESRIGAEDLLGSREDRGALGDAADWLRELLAEGPVLARDVKVQAVAAGHAWRTVERSKHLAGVTVAKLGGPGKPWTWRLPGDAPPQLELGDNASSPPRSGGVGGLSSGEVADVGGLTEDRQAPPKPAKPANRPRAHARASGANHLLDEDELVDRLKRELGATELGPEEEAA